MSDIVERLRDYDKCTVGPQEAATEIERLRAENETLRRDVKTAVMGDSAELQDVKRENEKLLNANLSLRNKYLRLQHKLGRIAKVLDEPTVAAAAIRESGE